MDNAPLINSNIIAQEERFEKEKSEATKLSQKSKNMLKEAGLLSQSKEEWMERLHTSRVNHMTNFLIGENVNQHQMSEPTVFTR